MSISAAAVPEVSYGAADPNLFQSTAADLRPDSASQGSDPGNLEHDFESQLQSSRNRGPQQCEGLGNGLGGQIVRSCFAPPKQSLMENIRARNITDADNEMAKRYRSGFLPFLTPQTDRPKEERVRSARKNRPSTRNGSKESVSVSVPPHQSESSRETGSKSRAPHSGGDDRGSNHNSNIHNSNNTNNNTNINDSSNDAANSNNNINSTSIAKRTTTVNIASPPSSAPSGREASELPNLTVGGSTSSRGLAKRPSEEASKLLLSEGQEPEGAFVSLLLAEGGTPDPRLITCIAEHRWSFAGAPQMAQRGKGFSIFVWCLLELQKNLQTKTGDPLESSLENASQCFVAAQSRKGCMADMYQVLTHFTCNSILWHEWHRFLRVSFQDERATQEAFLVPRIEQVWFRFLRLLALMSSIFGVLDSRFVWRHRLPKVQELLLEHMRKRCFPLDQLSKNELFLQATTKNETVKQIKFAFNLT